MKIATSDGKLVFGGGILHPRLSQSNFLASYLGKSAEVTMRSEEWIHYQFRPEDGITCIALFKGERLDRVFVSMAVPADSTTEWSERNELERKSLHDEWLLRELGLPPYRYSWGVVESDYDSRGCESDIIVAYEP